MPKIKINIPAQTLEVELDFQPIWEMEPPKPEPLPIPEEKPVNPPNEPVIVEPEIIEVANPKPLPIKEVKPVIIEPIPTPIIQVGMEVIDISENFLGKSEIKLESGKHYKAGLIRRQMIHKRSVKINSESPENRPILELGVEKYRPLTHGKQDKSLFLLAHDSTLVINNVDVCQSQQIKTVEAFNPRILEGIQQRDATWTAVIRNCDTTRLGKNGGFGLGFMYGSPNENHVALLGFEHFGNGLMDAKNSFQDGIMYVTLRDVNAYAKDDTNLSQNDFQHIGSLKDNVLTFDGSVYSLSLGYNWTWMDNASYIVLWDRFTFFLDGYLSDTVVSENQFRVRPQAKGKCTVGVLSDNQVYSDSIEMHAGDKFIFRDEVYTILLKDRIAFPLFDDRSPEAKKEPLKSRALVYRLDKPLPVIDGLIEIEYLSEQIEFTDQPITLLYRGNGQFNTTINTKYRHRDMLNSNLIGHLCYNHSDISMDASNSKLIGFYRGSTKGRGKSLIWNLDNCEGFEESGDWFMTAIPVTNIPNLPLHKRIAELI